MAITRSQQARQLYIKGGQVNPDGRLGFFKGAEKDAREKGTSISPGTDAGGNVRDDNPFTGGGDQPPPPKEIKPPPKKPKETNINKFKRTVSKYGPFSYLDKLTNSKLARINNALQRQNYIDSLDLNNPKEKEEYDRIMNQLGGLGMDIIAGPKDLENTMLSVPPSMLATNPMTQFKTVDGVSTLGNPGVDDVLGTGYDEYLNRFNTEDTGGRDDPMDPCKGPNPPAYCFVGIRSVEPEMKEEYVNPLSLLTPRIAGTQFAADGGRIGLFKGAVASGENISPGTDTKGNVRDDNPFTGGGGDGPKTIPTVNPVGSNEPDVNPIFNKALKEPELRLEAFIKKMELENRMKEEEEDDEENMAGGILVDAIRNAPELKQRISTIDDAIKSADLNFAGGGIASLDREAFLLGGIAKGLKKAVRGVKKIAKSPIGKAALLGAGMFGIPGTTFGGLLGRASFGGAAQGMFGSFGPVSALKKLGIMKTQIEPNLFERVGLLSKLNLPMAGIFGASALAGLMTPKEDEDEFDVAKYYAQSLDPSLSIRGMGSDFDFDFYGARTQAVADGGRIGYQEGSKEPVAKKTLPLIDMDGMEKDYRETGGFVEMGRMEKADDVPARLSKNEFVFTADAVRNAGDGDIDKGAEVMYNMMKNLEAGGEVSEESQGLEGAREMFKTSQRLGEVL